MVLKAELHVHINGTISSDLLPELAERNSVPLTGPNFDADGNTQWTDYHDFHEAYSAGSAAVQNPRDFADVAYDYLRRCHEEGAIYVELMASPEKSHRGGSDFDENLHGIIDGIERAKQDFGIESRIILTAKRHRGPEDGFRMLRSAEKSMQDPKVRHYVTGFGMAGDETMHRAASFRDLFLRAKDMGLRLTAHAGEALGADGVQEVIDMLPVERIGHGVRAIEDPELVKELAERDILLEVCLRSNITLEVYPDFQSHPFNALREAGVKVSVNSDDPALFSGGIADEYKLAEDEFGMSPMDQLQMTRQAIEHGFMDELTQRRLLKRVDLAMENLVKGVPVADIDPGPQVANDKLPPEQPRRSIGDGLTPGGDRKP